VQSAPPALRLARHEKLKKIEAEVRPKAKVA
jgi:hypothetical protein